jgi:hypothetical protein
MAVVQSEMLVAARRCCMRCANARRSRRITPTFCSPRTGVRDSNRESNPLAEVEAGAPDAGEYVRVVGEQESDPLPARHRSPSYVSGVNGGNDLPRTVTIRGALPAAVERSPFPECSRRW